MIGYYVHHHGLGHATRAASIARLLRSQIIGFGSGPRPDGWPGDWVALPSDITDHPVDETAGGTLHWAPLGHRGYRERMALLADAVGGLDVLVVDVSVEVACLARLLGVPTVAVALRGDRSDAPHRLAHDSATALLAPWTQATGEEWWPASWTAKTCFAGPLSRFDEREVRAEGDQGVVLALVGAGGTDADADYWRRVRSHTPGWTWLLRGPDNPSADVWAELGAAAVVVGTAGNNTVSEVAAARRPAVVVAQDRPYGEQRATVAALRRAGVCEALESWPEPERWPDLLRGARARGGTGWAQWSQGDGAARAAAFLDELAGASA